MDEYQYLREFSKEGFWEKVATYARIAGAEVIEKALYLWYVLLKPDVPTWAKTTIVAALGYFISPIDAIPDMVPMIGFMDDLSVLALAVSTVSAYVDDEVRRKTREKMQQWFS